MLRYSVLGAGLRIVLLLLLVLVLLVGGLLWFDYLELIDGKQIISPFLRLVGIEKPEKLEDAEDPFLLEKERYAMLMESLTILEENLDQRELALQQKEAEQKQIMEELEEKERALQEREKSFNKRLKEYENRKVSLEITAAYLTDMPPKSSVDIMLAYEDDMEVIDLIRTADRLAAEKGDPSISAYWLSLMPADTAQRLMRKMNKGIVE